MSGLYISGMEMPKFGEKIIILTSSGYVEDVSGQVIDGVEAVPVPPHGRLIDADAFKKRMIQGALDAREDAATEEIWLKILDAVNNLCLDVDEQPTIIPADKEE